MQLPEAVAKLLDKYNYDIQPYTPQIDYLNAVLDSVVREIDERLPKQESPPGHLFIRLLDDFEAAIEQQSWLKCQHPDDHDSIREEYKRAREALLAYGRGITGKGEP